MHKESRILCKHGGNSRHTSGCSVDSGSEVCFNISLSLFMNEYDEKMDYMHPGKSLDIFFQHCVEIKNHQDTLGIEPSC